jgi:Lrp/AsnC family transcriptional regulator, leucine-responsive regulatory protein
LILHRQQYGHGCVGCGYPLTAIVRVRPTPGQLPRIPELARELLQVGECHRITGEDCFYLKIHLRSIEELSSVLDRFLAYGETTTSIVKPPRSRGATRRRQ